MQSLAPDYLSEVARQIGFISAALGVVSGITEAGVYEAEPVAFLRHNLQGQQTLRSYAYEAAEEPRQIDQVYRKLYGFIIKSPKTPYTCTWRDTKLAEVTSGKPTKPSQIFLACIFGTSPWTPPPELAREAEQRVWKDEGVIRVQWDRDGERYNLSRFDVELRTRGVAGEFRSINFKDELPEVTVKTGKMTFPSSSSAALEFNISAAVPYRRNRGAKKGAPVAKLTIMGTALHVPRTVTY